MAKYKATTVVYFSYLLEADSEQQAEQQARELAEEGNWNDWLYYTEYSDLEVSKEKDQ